MKLSKPRVNYIEKFQNINRDGYELIEVIRERKNQKSRSYYKVRHNCGYIYTVDTYAYERGCGCPKCSHRYKLTHSEFLDKVKDLVGDEYEVLSTFYSTHQPVKFKHHCGYIFEMEPNLFLNRGTRCPRCQKRIVLQSDFEERVAAYNNDYIALELYQSTDHPIAFQHKSCGHIFKRSPHEFFRGRLCPVCGKERAQQRTVSSCGEKYIREILIEYHIDYVSEKKFPTLKNDANRYLRFDFYLPQYNTCIEFDGRQHFENIEAWGGEKELATRQYHDQLKNDFCKINDIPLLRIKHTEIKNAEELITAFLNINKTEKDNTL